MKVTAHAVRSGDWWSVDVPEVDGLFTQARRLDQIPAMVADAGELLTDIPAAEFEVTLDYDFDPAARREIEEVKQLNAAAQRAVDEASPVACSRPRPAAARSVCPRNRRYVGLYPLAGFAARQGQGHGLNHSLVRCLNELSSGWFREFVRVAGTCAQTALCRRGVRAFLAALIHSMASTGTVRVRVGRGGASARRRCRQHKPAMTAVAMRMTVVAVRFSAMPVAIMAAVTPVSAVTSATVAQ